MVNLLKLKLKKKKRCTCIIFSSHHIDMLSQYLYEDWVAHFTYDQHNNNWRWPCSVSSAFCKSVRFSFLALPQCSVSGAPLGPFLFLSFSPARREELDTSNTTLNEKKCCPVRIKLKLRHSHPGRHNVATFQEIP